MVLENLRSDPKFPIAPTARLTREQRISAKQAS